MSTTSNPRPGAPSSPLRALTLVLSLTASLLLGCSGDDPSALLASAKVYLAKKDNAAATIQLKNALQQKPDLAEARFLLGRTLLDEGDAVSGEVELKKALDLKYPPAAVLPPLARALVQQGKGQRVIQDYASTDLSDASANAELKTALALAFAQQGDRNKAIAMLDDALGAAPDSAPALLLQARLKATPTDVDTALQLVDRVLAKDSADAEALQLKGTLLFTLKGNYADGLRMQRLALEARPDWWPARVNLVEMMLTRRDLDGARAQVAEMKKAHPQNPQVRFFEARIAFLSEDYKTARDLLQQFLVAFPDNLNALLLASATELRVGSPAQAEAFAAKALQRYPESSSVRRQVAQIQLRAGEARKAQATLQPLLDKPGVDADSLSLAAQAAMQLGDASAAEGLFTRAAKMKPDDPRSRTALALVESARGNSDKAMSELEDIAGSDSGTIADAAIVVARLRQRDFAGAMKAVEALERKQPGTAFAAQMRGQIEAARKDPAAARRAFEAALAIDPLYFPAASSLAMLDLAEGKADEARKRFDKLLAADPKDVRTLLAIVELRSQAGAGKDELASLLLNAIKVNPSSPTPRRMLVDLYLRTKDARAANTAATEAIAALPDNASLLDALGNAQLASGDSTQAIGTFKKLAGIQPRSPDVQTRLADAYVAANNRGSAREALGRALELSPKFLPAQRSLVQLEMGVGQPDQAMAVARQVQKERPGESIGYLMAGDIEAYRKGWDAATASYRTALGKEPSTEAAVKLHNALLSSKMADAEPFAIGWVKEHPADAGFHGYLADVALKKRDFARAESEYQAVLKLQPHTPVALNNLAWVTYKLGKPGAAAFAERANALIPGQPAFMDTLAVTLSAEGQETKALDIEKQAVALQPEYPAFRLNLAKLYVKTGQKALARKELEELSKLGAKFPEQAEVEELLKAL